MTAIVVEWLLRPETLAWTSVAFFVAWALQPIGRYLDREATLEDEIASACRPRGT